MACEAGPRTGARVTFAPMKLRHLPEVLAIERASFVTPWTRQGFVFELLHNECARYIVALVAGRVVGYAGIWVLLDEAHLTSIAVHPEWRGRGLGRALMEEMLALARSLGVRAMTLEVRPSNLPARRLYASLGFEERGRRKGYYADTGEDALIMWKEW